MKQTCLINTQEYENPTYPSICGEGPGEKSFHIKAKVLLIAFIFVVFTAYADGRSVSEANVNSSKIMICSLANVKKTEAIPLSSLVETCTLIHFEDNDDAFFKPWFTTVSDKYIGIRQQDGGVFKLFDRSGKFLCNVGSIGQGPGEYAIALYDEIIDDKNNLIYLAPMTGDKILVYNTSGKFIKNIVSPQQLHKPKLHLSNGILTVVHMAFGGEKAIAIQFDSNGKVIKSLAPPTHLLVTNYNGEIFNARNTPAFDFLHTSSDTLYHYNIKENKIVPVYTIAVNSSEKPFRQYVELNNYFITNVFGKGLVATDKKKETSSYIRIVNDYYGNLAMPGYIINFRNGWYVYNLEPAQLKEEIKKRLAESSCTKQDSQQLKKLLSTLDEEANNVLFLGKLK
ncbi:MAG: 6-bladed beta-propeller [Candidatus Symbiothrix sp.]|jgi:hypothetical protein|nr:6-bladed beta-propeller [Candidatus Symbiothrix sp.]